MRRPRTVRVASLAATRESLCAAMKIQWKKKKRLKKGKNDYATMIKLFTKAMVVIILQYINVTRYMLYPQNATYELYLNLENVLYFFLLFLFFPSQDPTVKNI